MKPTKILSLLLCVIMILCLLPAVAGAAGTTQKFQSENSYITVTVSDADIVKAEQNGSSASVTIYLTNVKNNAVTISVQANMYVFSGSGKISLTDGTGKTNIQLKPNSAHNAPVLATWSVELIDADVVGGIEKPATIEMVTDLDEAEVKYTVGNTAGALCVEAKQSKGEPVTYQWYKNTVKSLSGGTVIENATEPVFSPHCEAEGTTYYYAVACCGDLSVASKIATVTVEAPIVKFTEDLSENEISCTQGRPVPALAVTAVYTGTTDTQVAYQWYSNTIKSTDGAVVIDGETGASYTPSSENIGTVYYYATASCEEKSAVSKIAVVTVEPPVVNIVKDLDEQETICVFGKKAPTLTIQAEYTGVTENAITYQWYSNSVKNTENGTLIENETSASYTPKNDTIGTVYYYVTASCDGISATSKAAMITVVEDLSPASGLWLGIEKSNGSLNFVKFTDVNGNDIEGIYSSFENNIIDVVLPHSYSVGGQVKQTFNLTQTGDFPFLTTKTGVTGAASGKAENNKFTEKTVTLKNGKAEFTFYLYDSKPTMSSNKYDMYTVKLSLANVIPYLAYGWEASVSCEIAAGETYLLDLSTVFCDADGDNLTYSVKINGEAAVSAEENYSFVPEIGGKTYTLEFFASDFVSTSGETYKVTLNATNSAETYDISALVPENVTPSFFVTNGYDDNGADIPGEALTAVKGETADGITAYTVSVPQNISEISVRDELYGGMAFAVYKDYTVSLRNVQLAVNDYNNNEAVSTSTVTCGDKTVVSGENGWLTVAENEYVFTVVPRDSTLATAVRTVTVENGADILTVQIVLSLKNPMSITVPTGATAQLYKYNKYYDNTGLEAKIITDNGDGTTTFKFVADTKAHGASYIYRVSMEDKITKAGWVAWGQQNMTVTYTEKDKSPSCRLDDYSTTGEENSTLTEDSVFLNINSRNHLNLSVGDSKTLKAYRAWEIIPVSYNNYIITPDFTYTVVHGGDVVSLTEKASLSAGEGDWMTVTALKEGVAVIEVTYDAIEVSGGSFDGVYGASDPNRTGLLVVQVGENNDSSVRFGIDCFTSIGTSGNKNITFNPDNKREWDAEFDTLYFTGNSGKLTFKPTASSDITCVSVSHNKGNSWTELAGENGVYTAVIVPGNNILRVQTKSGTAYQVVRGDKITVKLNEVSDNSDGDGIAEAGETIRVTLIGLHTPIPKMAGNYNPGYGANQEGYSSQHLNYTCNGAAVYGAGTQYTFVTNATLDVVMPDDGGSVTLSNGYIGVGVMGLTEFANGGDSHRNIPDSGCSTRGDKTTFHTRSILPDITVFNGDASSPNNAPVVRADAITEKSIYSDQKFAVNPETLFTDPDGNTMTFTVSVGGAEAENVSVDYMFTPGGVGTYTLLFIATDGKESVQHTVTVKVTKRPTQQVPENNDSFGLDKSEIAGYVIISFVDNGVRQEGETGLKYPTPLGTIIKATRVPYRQGEKITHVTERLLDYFEIGMSYTGTLDSGFYLGEISNFEVNGVNYDSMGEYDAGEGSGWMITLNGKFIEYGASEFTVKNGDVIKWQYTCQLGKDIGDPFYSENFNPILAPKEEEQEKEDEQTEDRPEEAPKLTFTETTFADIKKEDWYYESVKYVYENNLMQGTDKGFEPDGKMSRAMLVTVLYRTQNKSVLADDGTPGVSPFADVAPGQWYTDAVVWASANGIIKGMSETEFAPDRDVSREQMALIIYRFAMFIGCDVSVGADILEFADVNEVSDWAIDALSWANNTQLIKGASQTTISPSDTATRAQVATILMRFCENIAK